MGNFNWIVPTRFVFGKGVESETGTWAKSECREHALVVFGGGHVVRSGLLAAVTSSLEAAGVEVTELGGVRPNPEVTTVHEGIKLAREKQVVLVVLVGGGSVIDCSQAIARGTRLDRDIWDVFSPESQAPFADVLPLAVVLTIPAAGSESSDSCVISNDDLGLKSAIASDLICARVAFIDPELTMSLPAWQTFVGVTDMCAHIMELFFSSSEDVISTANPHVPRRSATPRRPIRTCATICSGCSPRSWDSRQPSWDGSRARAVRPGIRRQAQGITAEPSA